MNHCPICEKHENSSESKVFESKSWIVYSGPLSSQVLGYTYLEPKSHVENWGEMTTEELAEIAPLIQRIEQFVKSEIAAERLYVVTISEAVKHLHFHLIPRSEDNPVRGLSLIEQATQQNGSNEIISSEEYERFLNRFREYMV